MSRFSASLLPITGVVALLLCPQFAFADQKPDKHDADASSSLQLPPTSTTSHSITLKGETLHYTAHAGTLPLTEANGKTTANIFYVAYTLDGQSSRRPITFVFNGGPGAASAYLQIGGIGPRVVTTTGKGEFGQSSNRLIDNPGTWLDLTDLVFVDPVGTGYSRAAEGKSDDDFWSVDSDMASMADFVRLYLTENSRLISPVFLAGESYGGFRVAGLARKLQQTGAASPSGVIMISPVLDFSTLEGEDYDPLTWAFLLPSLAAVNLEKHGTTTREGLAAGLKDAEHFALAGYLVDLASGSEAGGKAASNEVAELTGLPLDDVQQQLARISASHFIKEFGRAGGQVLSRYDGSVTGPDPNPTSSHPTGPDPVLDATVPIWTSAFVNYAGSELGYKTDAAYKLLNREARQKWDFGTSGTHQGYAGMLDELQDARAQNPSLQVMIAAGYTDLITPYLATSFIVNQLPTLKGAAPIEVDDYAGGHMLYLRPTSREALKQDVKGVYERAAKASSEG